MAKPRNPKNMIYVAHTESTARTNRNGNTQDAHCTGYGTQHRPSLDPHPLAQACNHNRSLVFGPAIVRKSRSDTHLCADGNAAMRHVNRLWYGRALVALRTYPQWTLRAEALSRQCGLMKDGDDACSIALGNPVQ